MKKLRKLLSLSTALLLATASVTSLNVSAVLGEEYAQGTIENVAESFGEDAYVNYYNLGEQANALIIDEDGSSYVFYEKYYQTYISVAEEKTLPLDEINEKIAPYAINGNAVTGYTLKVRLREDQQRVYDILKSYDEVSSIDEKVEIYRVRDSHWAWTGILFESSGDVDKAIELVPEMNFRKEVTKEEHELYGVTNEPGLLYLSEFVEFSSSKTLDKNIYDSMKKLSESGLKYESFITTLLSIDEKCSSGVFNIYTAESVKSDKITADYDNNGKADLTDLTALSLYLIGDATWNDEQVNNFDCNADGSTNLADLAHLKQYIMGEDVKLG